MRTIVAFSAIVIFSTAACAQNIPKVADPRLVVELVAQQPDIVHPISCEFDHTGRLLVIESHTHFAPKDYAGPKFDRVQAFDVSKPGSKPTTFFEGTRHTMDLAVHPFDGSVYLATRHEILRIPVDAKGGAGKPKRIVFLNTKGDYPHNGLSGLCFDSKGDLTFGMGENLGAKYTLIGADDVKITGEGDGGHIFHCSADGKKLRKVATGFWNPFGICRDIYGRVFCVDNDPDESPPCRMVHVVEGGDYGFRFCYGRSGKHPFQSWHGDLPGTLPMMTGVGEAPCEILSYESDGLPKEYLGKLMVTAWADHRVELYKVKPHGASFKAEREPFVQGGSNFRPTGMCVAPDGSLYVADWVLSNYTLHGKGALWHIRWKDAPKVERPEDPRKAILSMHRPLREKAARKLAPDAHGREILITQVDNGDSRVSVSALAALIDVQDHSLKPERLSGIANHKSDIGLRQIALRGMMNRGAVHALELDTFNGSKQPAILRAEALVTLSPFWEVNTLVHLFSSEDPFLRHAAIHQMAQFGRPTGDRLEHNGPPSNRPRPEKMRDPAQRIGYMLAGRQMYWRIMTPESYLQDADEDVRFMAVKWVADEKLADQRKEIEKLLADPKLSIRMYIACATALARLDGKDVNDKSLADYFARQLADDKTPAAQRATLVRLVPVTHKALTIDLLTKLLKSDDAALKLEAVRALAEHPSKKRHEPLLETLRNPKLSADLRAHSLLGLIDREGLTDELIALARDKEAVVQREAVRGLIGARLTDKQGDTLALRTPDTVPIDLLERVLDGKLTHKRPPAKDLDAWLKRLEGQADADAGARIFAHPKLGGCAKCHRIDGRGADVGPDLSNIGRTDRRHILESILQPSANVAPHYVAWHLETADGKVRNGMLLHTNLDEYTYLDAKGERFKVKTGDLVEQRPTAVSIMPEGLVDTMTDQEMRDLLAYLQARR